MNPGSLRLLGPSELLPSIGAGGTGEVCRVRNTPLSTLADKSIARTRAGRRSCRAGLADDPSKRGAAALRMATDE